MVYVKYIYLRIGDSKGLDHLMKNLRIAFFTLMASTSF